MKNIVFAFALFGSLMASAEANNEMVKVGAEGKLAVVNTCAAPTAPIEDAVRKLGNFLMINVESKTGSWSLAEAEKSLSATGANAAVFIVKDKELPISLIAMESKWGVVNAEGLSDKSLEKEILRVAIVVLGGASSKYTASTMRPVFSAQELEAKAGEIVTFDSLMAIFSYVPEMGIKQYMMMSREDAIEEGYIKADK